MKRQQGFGAIAAIVILVILAALAAAIVSVGATQQLGSAQDVMSARAWQAARAGNEWGLYQALKGRDWTTAGTTCDAGAPPVTLDLRTDTGFYVTVTCVAKSFFEGETTEDPPTPKSVQMYRIKAVACPSSSCPPGDSSPANLGYVERTRVVTAQNTEP